MHDYWSINVHHNDWESNIIIENNTLYKKEPNNENTNNFFINNHFLKITWNNNSVDYFLSSNEIDYYQVCEKYNHIFFENYSYYYVYDINKTKLYLSNHKIDICYDLNNIELYYFFNTNNNKFVLYDEFNNTHKNYILFLNKYYEESYFNSNFKMININDPSFNKLTLNLKNNEFYDNLNIKGIYKIFGTYLQINYLNKNNIYQIENNTYNKIIPIIHSTNLNDFDFNDIKDDIKTILFVSNNIDNNELIYYLTINNYNIIYFDNLKNKKYNTLYQNIKIIYYKNNHDLEKIKLNLNKFKKIKY